VTIEEEEAWQAAFEHYRRLLAVNGVEGYRAFSEEMLRAMVRNLRLNEDARLTI
jgi:hypothetical protein